MPQEIQIVPKYLHPHVETYVNDYTQFDDEAYVPVDDNSQFISVFRSSKGIDNTIVKKMDLKDFKKTYGESDYNKYGQPLMMPIALLSTGNASCYCMRIMPDDAYAANSVLSMKYKMDTDTGKFIVKFETSYVDKSSFSDTFYYKTQKEFKSRLRKAAMSLKTDEPDDDGFYCIPLVTFRMQGRGIYGNQFRWRIARNLEYEMAYGIKMFSFEALSVENGLSKVATYVGSLVTSFKYTKTTLINDIMDDADVGATVMDVQVFDDYLTEVYNKYVEFVNGLAPELQHDIPDLDEFDIFFGKVVGEDASIGNIQIVYESDDTDNITVDRPAGTALLGGDDGAFTEGNDPQSIYEAEIEAYKNAFNGTFDRSILSARRVPSTVYLDANYPFEIKEALVELATLRDDAVCFLDAGIETTLSQIDNIIDEYSVFDVRNISKDFQHYTIKDTKTRKKCEVTMTYYYALNLPNHYKVVGSWVPFVKSYAQLSGHVKNTLIPDISDVDSELKEKLYTNRFNYFETIKENVYQRACQNTAQNDNSDLLEENNMNTLFELKRILEMDCWNNLYNFTSKEDRALFTELENSKFESWIGRRLDTLSILFDVNEWEMERSIVHCYVSVQFRNLNKRTIIEIDVNKRNFLG